MTFPLEYTGTIRLSTSHFSRDFDYSTRFMEEVSRELVAAKGFDIRIDGNQISFRNGIFGSLNNWNILAQIDRGVISIESSNEHLTMHYRISFRQLLIVSIILVAFGLGAGLSSTNISFIGRLALIIGAWFWLFGMNYLVAIKRFPAFIETIAKRVKPE